MKKETASRTAQYMALFRAMETKRPAGQRIFNDPYAISFLDSGLQLVTRVSNLPGARQLTGRYIQQRVPGAFSSGVARTKYIDELLKTAVNNGVQQLIILGAGFDTRALRLDFLNRLPVIEIDHPDTQRLKTDKLKQVLGKLPDHIKYYSIDFNVQSLDELAAQHGIQFNVPTAVIWEGVTNYLTPAAIEATFRFLQRFSAGSYVVFTYVNQQVLDNPALFYGGAKLLHDLEKIEERWTFGLHPEAVPAFLKPFDLTLLEDLGAVEYRAKYLPHIAQPGYEFYRVAFAIKK